MRRPVTVLLAGLAFAFQPATAQDPNGWSDRLDSTRAALHTLKPGTEEHARNLLAMGRALRMLDRPDTALIVARSLIAALDTTPSVLLVSAYDMLGRAQKETGDPAGAMITMQRGLRIAQAANDPAGVRAALYQLSTANFDAGRFDDAHYYAARLLPLLEHVTDMRRAGVLNMLGNVFYMRQAFDSATVYYAEALDEAHRLGSPQVVTLAGNLAAVYAEMGRPEKGVALLDEELGRDSAMHLRDRMNLHNVRGYCLFELGRYDAAIRDLLRSEAINDSAVHELDRTIDNLTYLAASYKGQGDFRNALLSMEKLEAAKDSFHLHQQNTATLELEKKFQGELKQEHIDRLSAETREKSERLKRRDQLLYAAGAVLVLVIAMALLVWRNLKQKQRNVVLLAQLNELLQLKVLRSQMNPHFIHNSLNAIHGLVLKGEHEKARDYLQGFARLLRMVLDHSVRDRIALHEEIDFLNEYLKLEALRFADGLRWSVHADDALLDEDPELSALLVQPFVENAVWHGLAPKSGDRKVEVRFTDAVDHITCTIEDNGVGRQAEKAPHTDGHRSLGLRITGERLQLLAHRIEGTYRFEDLKNAQGQPAGTRVTLHLRGPGMEEVT